MGQNPIPFPVRAPLGIQMHTKKIKWPFAPGVQSHQGGLKCQPAALIHQAGVANGYLIGKLYCQRVYFGQSL